MLDVTGTRSKSISAMRTFVGVNFLGIRLSMGSVAVLDVDADADLCDGLFNGAPVVEGIDFPVCTDFRCSKSLLSDDEDGF